MNYNRLDAIQSLRFLGFLGIFLLHCNILELGFWAVSIFFVMSGFIMSYHYFDYDFSLSIKDCFKFSINRIKKLYPLYLITIIFIIKFNILGYSENGSTSFFLLVVDLFLLQAWFPTSDVYYSLNGVAWYLSVCLFLYFLFPYILKFLKKFNVKQIIKISIFIFIFQILSCIMVLLFQDNFSQIIDFNIWFSYINPVFRLFDFVIGCCFGIVFSNKKIDISFKLATFFEVIIVVIWVGQLFLIHTGCGIFNNDLFKSSFLYTITSVITVLLFALKKGFITNLLCCNPVISLGNISAYSFLIHQPVIRTLIINFVPKFPILENKYIFLIIALIITLILSYMYFMLINIFTKKR